MKFDVVPIFSVLDVFALTANLHTAVAFFLPTLKSINPNLITLGITTALVLAIIMIVIIMQFVDHQNTTNFDDITAQTSVVTSE
jgi:hypothetical protein